MLDDYGRGYIDNSRCAAVTKEGTAPLIKGVQIPVLIHEARNGDECGPEGKLFEQKPPAETLLEALLGAISGALSSKY